MLGEMKMYYTVLVESNVAFEEHYVLGRNTL
jgi:hypothetical protein